MNEGTYASLNSQMNRQPCEVEDTEDIFWLREADDYDSKVKLANLLVGQYRYREAIEMYRQAAQIRADDSLLPIRLAGAMLTVGEFEQAGAAYAQAVRNGATEKSIAYYWGIWHYLKGQYRAAADRFEQCLPCGDEMAVAVLYWHTLCCVRNRERPTLLSCIHDGMQVGHHTAYLAALRVFRGTMTEQAALAALDAEKSALDFVVLAYGLCVYLNGIGKTTDANALRKRLLEKESVWPCISYLAAWWDGQLIKI